MLETVNFEVALVTGGDALSVKVFHNQRTIVAYIQGYILDDLGSLHELSAMRRREQYLAVFNQNQDIILEKIVEKFNRNEQITIQLISNDFLTED
jgi:hypothetical protein